MQRISRSSLQQWICALPAAAALALGLASGAAAQTAPAPAADECITDISPTGPGLARTFQCAGDEVRFLVAVPPGCDQGGCGLIFDVPGATQTAESVNANTGLRQRTRELARPFIVVDPERPQEGGAPRFDTSFQGGSTDEIFAFMKRAATVFAVDRDRIHIGGFSQGGLITFNFLCDAERAAFIASAAPAAAAPRGVGDCFGAGAQFRNPANPILFFSGTQDQIAVFAAQAAAADSIVAGIGPVARTEVVDQGPNNFMQTRITGTNGRVLELVRYDNTNARLGGHCFVGPFMPNGGGCDDPSGFQIGQKALEFYLAHPKNAPAAQP